MAPADWIRLDTSEREAAAWKDWWEQFRNRFLELQVQRTLAGLATTKADTAFRYSLNLPASKEFHESVRIHRNEAFSRSVRTVQSKPIQEAGNSDERKTSRPCDRSRKDAIHGTFDVLEQNEAEATSATS